MSPSPYEILMVANTAGDDEIRRAYRRLAKRWHPDRCSGDPHATARLQAINAAYAALARTTRSDAETAERVLWRASREGESIVLSSTRLVHVHSGRTRRLALHDIQRVQLDDRSPSGAAVLLIRTAATRHSITLPLPLAARLAELVTARIG